MISTNQDQSHCLQAAAPLTAAVLDESVTTLNTFFLNKVITNYVLGKYSVSFRQSA